MQVRSGEEVRETIVYTRCGCIVKLVGSLKSHYISYDTVFPEFKITVRGELG